MTVTPMQLLVVWAMYHVTGAYQATIPTIHGFIFQCDIHLGIRTDARTTLRAQVQERNCHTNHALLYGFPQTMDQNEVATY